MKNFVLNESPKIEKWAPHNFSEVYINFIHSIENENAKYVEGIIKFYDEIRVHAWIEDNEGVVEIIPLAKDLSIFTYYPLFKYSKKEAVVIEQKSFGVFPLFVSSKATIIQMNDFRRKILIEDPTLNYRNHEDELFFELSFLELVLADQVEALKSILDFHTNMGYLSDSERKGYFEIIHRSIFGYELEKSLNEQKQMVGKLLQLLEVYEQHFKLDYRTRDILNEFANYMFSDVAIAEGNIRRF